MRRLSFAVAVLLSMAILLMWAAGVDWQSPIAPEQTRNWSGSDFRVVMGGAAEDESRLRIGAVGEGGASVNNQRIGSVDWTPDSDDFLHDRWLVLRRGKRNVAGVSRTL